MVLSPFLPFLHPPATHYVTTAPPPVAAAPPPPPPPPTVIHSTSSSSMLKGSTSTRRILLATTSSLAVSSLFQSIQTARAQEEDEDDEEQVVRIFQDATASVVCIKDLQLVGDPRKNLTPPVTSRPARKGGDGDDDRNLKVDGTGSGFIWDNKGHIVTNYHVIAKYAMDRSGLHFCKVFLQDSSGKTFAKEGQLIGFDPAYDIAVLKVDVEGDKLRPAAIGSSHDLHVGQSCFAIGNPYGYEHTLTTGVVSGLGREIPSPNGQSIRGAIQTDAAINAGNSGGPLIDSYGHVIGVNTATFTRKGTGLSSGVNFAIPIDTVVRTVPYLIVYGTATTDRF